MAQYAGEAVRIAVTAYKYGSTDKLTDTDVASVTVDIWDTADDSHIEQEPLTYDATEELFEYVWDTPSTAGKFLAKCKITDANGHVSWEYKTIKTKPSKDGSPPA